MRYYLIAGEASGDLHGSNLLKGLFAEDTNAQVRYRGGDMMTAAEESVKGTCSLVQHYRDGAVMGITDILLRARKLLGELGRCKNDILSWKPDVVILIDYPGFNMKIAEFCHKNGIRVFYYIAPKTWASRESRNEKLKAWVDRLFIVFPFEIPYFTQKQIPFIYKGNPLVDAVDAYSYRRPFETAYIALLPGSRSGEISRMMPVCMEVADRLGYRVVIAGAPSRSLADYEKYIGDRTNVEVLFGRTYDILKYADAAIINSGTASLEAALIGVPQVVCWSTTAFTAFVGRKILKVMDHIKYISLGNLCLDRLVFRELIQEEFNADSVSEEVNRLIYDKKYRSAMMEGYDEIRQSLGGTGASKAVAAAMIKELEALQPKP